MLVDPKLPGGFDGFFRRLYVHAVMSDMRKLSHLAPLFIDPRNLDLISAFINFAFIAGDTSEECSRRLRAYCENSIAEAKRRPAKGGDA